MNGIELGDGPRFLNVVLAEAFIGDYGGRMMVGMSDGCNRKMVSVHTSKYGYIPSDMLTDGYPWLGPASQNTVMRKASAALVFLFGVFVFTNSVSAAADQLRKFGGGAPDV